MVHCVTPKIVKFRGKLWITYNPLGAQAIVVSFSVDGSLWSTPQTVVDQGHGASIVNFEDSLYLVYADSDTTGQLHMIFSDDEINWSDPQYIGGHFGEGTLLSIFNDKLVMLYGKSSEMYLTVFDSVNGWSDTLKGPSTSVSSTCVAAIGDSFYVAYSESSQQLFVARSSDLFTNTWEIQKLEGQKGIACSLVGLGQQLLLYYESGKNMITKGSLS